MRSYHIIHYPKVVFILFIFVCFLSCNKLVEVDPPYTQYSGDLVFNNDATAIAAVTGIYSNLIGSFSGSSGMSFLPGLSADEFTLAGITSIQSYIDYYQNNLSPTRGTGSDYWNNFYNTIYSCNDALEKMQSAEGLSAAVKQQLRGEALFIRGFIYFYLTNLYGNVPMPLSTDYKVNALLPNTASDKIYEQVTADLQEAESLLSDQFLDGSLTPYTGTPERVRPTKAAAAALLASVYLYTGKYTDAATAASRVIDNPLFSLADLSGVFLKNSSSAVWQLQPVNAATNTDDASIFIIPSTSFSNSQPVSLRFSLLESFEPGDLRKGEWTGYIELNGIRYDYPYKYKIFLTGTDADGNYLPAQEYLMILRIEEQYLIRAEAEAQTGDNASALRDLDVIRIRAGLSSIAATDAGISQAALLDTIAHENQIEFFAELGHRWFDLKRTGKVNPVMQIVCPQKGGTWNPNCAMYPIPRNDIDKDPNLVQNDGYQ